MKSWLRWGLIVVFFGLIYFIIFTAYCNKDPIECGAFFWLPAAAFAIVLFLLVPSLCGWEDKAGLLESCSDSMIYIPAYSFALITTLISFFIIGALIGWIIEKIKSRNSSPI